MISQWVRKISIAACSLFLLLIISGCWSSLELNERAFIKTMIVDKSDQGVELTLAYPLTNRLVPGMAVGSGQSQGKAYSYVSGSGEDLGQAFRNIQMNLSRRISFGQTRVIVMGRELAEEGAEPVLEFVGRNAPFYLNTKLYVTTGKAKDLTAAAVVSERFPSDILTATSKFHTAIDTSIKDFLEANYNGGDTVVPLLGLKMKRIETEKEKEQLWIEKAGAAIFKQGKMVGTLSIQEMRGGLWILGQLADAEITVASPTDGKNVSFMIRNVHTRIKPKLGHGRTMIQIETSADASVISSDSNINLVDPYMVKKVENNLNREIHKRITEAITKTRDMQSDAFQLGSYIDWYYPREWKHIKPEWREIYASRLYIRVRPDVKVKQFGTTRESVMQRMERESRGEK